MGALTGSLNTTKFFVDGSLPKDVRRSFVQRIGLRTFRPLLAEEEADERFGWCALGQAMDLELTPDKLFVGPYLTLGLRTDRYRFPPHVVRAELGKAMSAALRESGRERLSRTKKAELEQHVRRMLRRKYLPSISAVDLVWNLNAGELFFWSQSGGPIERLGALFELTFGLTLVQTGPFVLAQRAGSGKQSEVRLESVSLTTFHAERAQHGLG